MALTMYSSVSYVKYIPFCFISNGIAVEAWPNFIGCLPIGMDFAKSILIIELFTDCNNLDFYRFTNRY